MSYKPFKVNKGEYPKKNNYKDYYYQDRQKIEREKVARLKTFGLRSGKAWKMMLALLYYLFIGNMIVLSIYGEAVNFEFELSDVIRVAVKYVFVIILFFAPLIFLSDYRYTRYLPLFNSGNRRLRLLGLVLVIVLSYAGFFCCNSFPSIKYHNSTVKYYNEQETKLKEITENNNLENSTKE